MAGEELDRYIEEFELGPRALAGSASAGKAPAHAALDQYLAPQEGEAEGAVATMVGTDLELSVSSSSSGPGWTHSSLSESGSGSPLARARPKQTAKEQQSGDLADLLDVFRQGLDLPGVRRRKPSSALRVSQQERGMEHAGGALEPSEVVRPSSAASGASVCTSASSTWREGSKAKGTWGPSRELGQVVVQTEAWSLVFDEELGRATFVNRASGQRRSNVPEQDVSRAQRAAFEAALAALEEPGSSAGKADDTLLRRCLVHVDALNQLLRSAAAGNPLSGSQILHAGLPSPLVSPDDPSD